MAISKKTFIERKNRIIEAATKTFIKNEFISVTMDIIAEKANMTKPTLYKYFGSKEELYYVVCCVATYNRWNNIKPKESEGKSGFQLVKEFAENYIAHAYDNPDLFYFLTNSNQNLFELLYLRDDINLSLKKEYFPLVQQAYDKAMAMFDQGYRDGSIKKMDDFSTEMFFIYSLRSYLLERVIAILKYVNKGLKPPDDYEDFMKMIKKEVNYLKGKLLKDIKVS